MLRKVAAVADDLQCSIPVKPFVRQWSSKAGFWEVRETPMVLIELLEQIFVCLVFEFKEKFTSATHELIMQSASHMNPYGIPIYPSVLQAIADKRTAVLNVYLKHLYRAEKELEDETLCWECRAENIGYLKYNLHLHKLPASEPSEQWAQVSCQELKGKMKRFRYGSRSGCKSCGQPQHPSLKNHIERALKLFASPDEGLDLSSFLKTSSQ
ncbi:hypothetical protein V8C42DRAFT_94412 [Trichoderma barbatum]